ncbi:MAG: GntR family transcriptional regulator, partial [Cyanobacteria bacterium]|nr:GntR family transcriptional regulator [Cyanobacteriota bacterium]
MILRLELMPGEMLPSTRELASALGLSRKTVCRGYEDLAGRGFIETELGVGTYVTQANPLIAETSKKGAGGEEPLLENRSLTRYARKLLSTRDEPTHQGDIPELHYGAPPVVALPTHEWRQVLLRELRNSDPSQFYYDTDPFGYLPLRAEIAGYLK